MEFVMSGNTRSELCDVYLCKAPIEQSYAVGRAVSFIASTSRSVCGDSWDKHWLLAFDYGEDKVHICEARSDQAGDLTGYRYLKQRTAFEENYPHKRHLGKHHIPKSHNEEVMKNMCDSGSYHITANNCQKWVQDFLRQLGIEPPREQRDADIVVTEVFQPLAVKSAVALALGVGALGALIFAGRARRNNQD